MLQPDYGLNTNFPMLTRIVPNQSKFQTIPGNAYKVFDTEFKCREILLDFDSHIRNCFQVFAQLKCFSPYVVLAQSSGSGKTRLLIESANVEPIVFFNCMTVQNRPVSEGFTFIMDTLLNLEHSFDASWSEKNGLEKVIAEKSEIVGKFFKAIYVWVIEHLLSSFSGEDFDEEKIRSCMLHMTQMFFNFNSSGRVWQEIFDIYRSDLVSLKLQNLTKTCKNRPWIQNRIVVLAFDEASPLAKDTFALSSPALPFRILRRAVQSISCIDTKMVLVFSGTSSKLANFAPHKPADSSIRKPDEFYRLFPVFILKHQDTFVPDYTFKLMNMLNIYQTIANRSSDEEFYFLGRPLWGSEYRVLPQRSLKTLVDFAVSKLKGPDNSVDCLDWYGIILVRIAMTISPLSRFADELVARNMASLHLFSHENHAVMMSYISEPILAIAASKLINNGNVRQKILTSLSAVTSYEMCTGGSRGEYVFQFACMDVVDFLTAHDPVKPIVLKDFLLTLFGSEAFSMILNHSIISPDEFDTGLISLLQFKCFEYNLDKECLRLALIRGLGIVPKFNNSGYDLCIPFILPCGEISGIFIEVKDWLKRFDESKKFETFSLAAEKISQKAIRVLVNMRGGKCQKRRALPTCEYISEHSTFHVDFFFNGRTEFFPKEYVRLLKAGTKYHEISGLQADNFSQFKIRQEYSRYYNTALDIGLSCFPHRPESKTSLASDNESTVTTENEELESFMDIKSDITIDNGIKEGSKPTTADVVNQSLHEDNMGKEIIMEDSSINGDKGFENPGLSQTKRIRMK